MVVAIAPLLAQEAVVANRRILLIEKRDKAESTLREQCFNLFGWSCSDQTHLTLPRSSCNSCRSCSSNATINTSISSDWPSHKSDDASSCGETTTTITTESRLEMLRKRRDKNLEALTQGLSTATATATATAAATSNYSGSNSIKKKVKSDFPSHVSHGIAPCKESTNTDSRLEMLRKRRSKHLEVLAQGLTKVTHPNNINSNHTHHDGGAQATQLHTTLFGMSSNNTDAQTVGSPASTEPCGDSSGGGGGAKQEAMTLGVPPPYSNHLSCDGVSTSFSPTDSKLDILRKRRNNLESSLSKHLERVNKNGTSTEIIRTTTVTTISTTSTKDVGSVSTFTSPLSSSASSSSSSYTSSTASESETSSSSSGSSCACQRGGDSCLVHPLHEEEKDNESEEEELDALEHWQGDGGNGNSKQCRNQEDENDVVGMEGSSTTSSSLSSSLTSSSSSSLTSLSSSSLSSSSSSSLTSSSSSAFSTSSSTSAVSSSSAFSLGKPVERSVGNLARQSMSSFSLLGSIRQIGSSILSLPATTVISPASSSSTTTITTSTSTTMMTTKKCNGSWRRRGYSLLALAVSATLYGGGSQYSSFAFDAFLRKDLYGSLV